MVLKILILVIIICIFIIYEYIKDKIQNRKGKRKEIVIAQNQNAIEVYKPQYGNIEPISHIERKTTKTNTVTTTETIYYYHHGGEYIEDIH